MLGLLVFIFVLLIYKIVFVGSLFRFARLVFCKYFLMLVGYLKCMIFRIVGVCKLMLRVIVVSIIRIIGSDLLIFDMMKFFILLG